MIDNKELDLALPFGSGPLTCPVSGCGCANQHLSNSEGGEEANGESYVLLTFLCEWGHSWSLRLDEYHGATLYSVMAWHDYGEDST